MFQKPSLSLSSGNHMVGDCCMFIYTDLNNTQQSFTGMELKQLVTQEYLVATKASSHAESSCFSSYLFS
jgi:hypothetical protein